MYSKELNLKAQELGGVRKELLKGTEDLLEDKILDRIMHNFANIGFEYTMIHVSHTELLDKGRRQGDCRTLAEAFVQIANDIGFDDVKLGSAVNIDFVAPGKPCIDKNKKPNANRGRHWAFQNHYWGVDGNRNVYDILFTAREVDENEMKWMHKQSPIDPSTGLKYETYGGKRFYSGSVGPDDYAMVCLEEDELAKIRENYKIYKAIEDSKASSQKTEKETKSKEPKKEEPIFDLIRSRIEDLVPGDKVVRTAQALEKLVDPNKIRSETGNQLMPHVKKFCDGSNPTNFKFNEGKWSEWINSNI